MQKTKDNSCTLKTLGCRKDQTAEGKEQRKTKNKGSRKRAGEREVFRMREEDTCMGISSIFGENYRGWCGSDST